MRSGFKKPTNRIRRFSQIPESERFRFGTAFQLALAEATGVRFALIDRADVLDQQKRKLLTALLLNSGIDQGVVLATGENPPPMAIPTGVKLFDLAKTGKSAKQVEPEPPSATPIQSQFLAQCN